MASLYADENFPLGVVVELRKLGQDVLTAQEAGQVNRRIPDDQVLAYATRLGRSVLTHNRRHFIKLHKQTNRHSGIVACTDDRSFPALARRIHQALIAESLLDGKLIRVNKPAKP